MGRLKPWLRRCEWLWRSSRIHDEIAEEFQFHLDQRTEANIRSGMPPDAARRDALRRFGPLLQIAEQGYDVRGAGGLDALIADLRYATRLLVKNGGLTSIAMVTLALGIGASTAMFSVTHAVLLRPLPYNDPTRLVVIGGDMRMRHNFDEPLSYENYADLREGTRDVFDDMTAVVTTRNIFARGDGTPEQLKRAFVPANFFRLLGARIVGGRDFGDADGQPALLRDSAATPNQPQLPLVSIISYEYWQRRFGGSPTVFGHPLQYGANSTLIVGALAPEFELVFRDSADVERSCDIFTAMRVNYDSRHRSGFYVVDDKLKWTGLRAIARLKPGVSLERAEQSAGRVAAEVRRDFPVYGGGGFYYHLEPMHQHLVAEVRPAVRAFMGAVVFLLLIACANVANFLLVHTSLRERELAVRGALGATRARLIRQVLVEALLVAAGGTLLGIALASAGIRGLVGMMPPHVPRLDTIALDPAVLLFSIAAGLAAAAGFGIVPAWRASHPDLMLTLHGSGRTRGLGEGSLRNGVAVAEVALSFVLLIGSGLMMRSFIALQHIKLGFDPHHVLTFQVLPGMLESTSETRATRIREIQTALRQVSDVEQITAAALVPLDGGYGTIPWGQEAAIVDRSRYQAADSLSVLPGYFETMRTPLLAGRTFTEADNTPDRNLVIVDQVLAAKAFPQESAVGQRILISIRPVKPEWVEIIGVVAHQRATSIAESGNPQIYFTDGFLGHGSTSRWMLRTAVDPATVAPSVRAAIRNLDSNLLVNNMAPMTRLVERAQAGTRFSLLLLGTFATTATILASVGLYGVLAALVRQRTPEIGVRLALGALPPNIFALVVGQGLRLSTIGIGLGVIAAVGLTRVIASMLVGVQPTDPLTFGGIVVGFFIIAAVACWIPARRASGLDPLVALRDE